MKTKIAISSHSTIVRAYGRKRHGDPHKTITPANATNQNITWERNNTAVAMISSTGVVSPAAPRASLSSPPRQSKAAYVEANKSYIYMIAKRYNMYLLCHKIYTD